MTALPADEFADPARAPRDYVHEVCGTTTRMPEEMVRGYLANPHGYNSWAYCQKCDSYVHQRECRWVETGESLDTYFQRLKASVPRPASKVVFAAPFVLAAAGAGGGALVDGGRGAAIGAGVGIVVGAAAVALRFFGVR